MCVDPTAARLTASRSSPSLRSRSSSPWCVVLSRRRADRAVLPVLARRLLDAASQGPEAQDAARSDRYGPSDDDAHGSAVAGATRSFAAGTARRPSVQHAARRTERPRSHPTSTGSVGRPRSAARHAHEQHGQEQRHGQLRPAAEHLCAQHARQTLTMQIKITRRRTTKKTRTRSGRRLADRLRRLGARRVRLSHRPVAIATTMTKMRTIVIATEPAALPLSFSNECTASSTAMTGFTDTAARSRRSRCSVRAGPEECRAAR